MCIWILKLTEIPGDQEGSGLQSVGCREGWWGEEFGELPGKI